MAFSPSTPFCISLEKESWRGSPRFTDLHGTQNPSHALPKLSEAELVIASALADAPWPLLHGEFWLRGVVGREWGGGAGMGLLQFPGHGASMGLGLWVVLGHGSAPQPCRDPAPHRPCSRGG